MEGNERSLSSYYHQQTHHFHHHHHHQLHQQQHNPNGGATSISTANPNSPYIPNGILPIPHHNAASSGHYTTSEGTPLVFSPHNVTGRAPVTASAQPETFKKKRGRPRKYVTPEAAASATPASSAKKVSATSASSFALSPYSSSPRKKEQSSAFSTKKAQLIALGNAGQGFTPHVITVAAGEDVAQKIMSFMQQPKRAVCILSASGSISNPSLRQPATLGGSVMYEGRFEILSLTGSYLHSEVGGASSRTGGLSICLSGSDGRVVGGGVGGPLKAAGPVQVIVGSFVIDTKREASGGLKADASTSKLPSPQVGATISTLGFRQSMEISERISVMRNDEHQNIGSGHFTLHPGGMHVTTGRSTDWRNGPDARNYADTELIGRTDRGACPSPVDGEGYQIHL